MNVNNPSTSQLYFLKNFVEGPLFLIKRSEKCSVDSKVQQNSNNCCNRRSVISVVTWLYCEW